MVASVGVRLVADGVDLARRGFSAFGDAGRKAMEEVEKAAKGTGVAARATGQALDQAKGVATGFASEAGPIGELLTTFGPAGIAAAAGIGAFALGMAKARESMDFADDLVAAAAKIGITVESLQELQFAAGDADVEVGDLRGGMEQLNGVVGAVKTGLGDAKFKAAFSALGVNDQQLKSMDTASDALVLLADRFAALESQAEQVKLAKQLGIEALLPLLRQGSDKIRELSEDSRELGLVMSDDVANGLADASRELEIAEQRIDVGLKIAFAGLSDEVVFFNDKLADSLVWLNRMIERADVLAAKIDRQGEPFMRNFNVANTAGRVVRRAYLGDEVVDAEEARRNAPRAADAVRRMFAAGRQMADASRAGSRARDRTNDDDEADTPPRGSGDGGGAAASATRAKADAEKAAQLAERAAEEMRRRVERQWQAMDRALTAAEEREARAHNNEFRSLSDRQVFEDEARSRERRRRDQELAEADLDDAQRLIVAIANAQADEAEDNLERGRQHRAVQEQQLAAARDEVAATVEVLTYQAAMAGTQRERRAIALEILEHERELARRALELTLSSDPELTEDDRQFARSAFGAVTARMRRDVQQSTRGPGEQYADELRDAARAGNEAFEAVAVDGLQTLSDGISGAILRTRELGDVFKDVAGQIIADLVRIGVQRAITAPLANMLFGGQRAAGGGGMGSLLGGVDDLLASGGAGYGPGHRPSIPGLGGPGSGWLSGGVKVLRGIFGFESGGYTGEGATNEVAGVVHKREFVSHAAATEVARPLLEALNDDPKGTFARIARSVMGGDDPLGRRTAMQATVGHLPGAPQAWRDEQVWRRQLGGGVAPGGLYSMAEDGRPEIYLATRPGQVLSSDQSVDALRQAVGGSAGGAATNVTHHHNYDLRGTVVDKDVATLMRETENNAVARAARQTPGIAVAAVANTQDRTRGRRR